MSKVLSSMLVIYREKAELSSYQSRLVALVLYTPWRDNMLIESGPIEWEEFKDVSWEITFPMRGGR